MTFLSNIAQYLLSSTADVLPIVVFLFAFQRLVIGERMKNGKQIAIGFLFVVVGLGLFLVGLEQSLFPDLASLCIPFGDCDEVRRELSPSDTSISAL